MENKQLKSFIYYPADHPFPLQNIPFGVFIPNKDHLRRPRCGTRIGDFVIDLDLLESKEYFNGEKFAALRKEGRAVFSQRNLNEFMSLGRPYWREARETIQKLFSEDGKVKDDMNFRNIGVHDYRDIVMSLPAQIGDYTDFYSSKNHAYNVGCIVRGPENALQANWTRLPVGYHGRASSIVLSGTDCIRPSGQILPKGADAPIFSATQRMDFELEIGAFFGGPANKLGHPIKIEEAEDRIFGLVLFNDWSARDIQTWEYVPLGPFNAKNFCSVISPWVITLDALEPFRVQLPKQDPEPLDYLKDPNLSSYDVKLDVFIQPEGKSKEKVSSSNFKHLYWSIAQQLAHHTVTGCNMQPGDLLASGTISGTEKSELGCLLEMSWAGRDQIKVGDETRTFLKDGDNVVIEGFCDSKEGFRIGFGECASKVLPALNTQGTK